MAELPELAWWAAQRIPEEMFSKSARESKRLKMMDIYSELIDAKKAGLQIFRDHEKGLNELVTDPNPNQKCQTFEAQLLFLFEQARQLGRAPASP